jgi:hypothetical protein
LISLSYQRVRTFAGSHGRFRGGASAFPQRLVGFPYFAKVSPHLNWLRNKNGSEHGSSAYHNYITKNIFVKVLYYLPAYQKTLAVLAKNCILDILFISHTKRSSFAVLITKLIDRKFLGKLSIAKNKLYEQSRSR